MPPTAAIVSRISLRDTCSWRSQPARRTISSGSRAHNVTDRLAEIVASPSRLNAYAAPGLSTPSRPSSAGASARTEQVLDEAGIDHGGARAKSMSEFLDRQFDHVITVCDNAAEACPLFPGPAIRTHWSIPDPALATGAEEEQLVVYRSAMADLRGRIADFLARLDGGAPTGRPSSCTSCARPMPGTPTRGPGRTPNARS